MPVYDYVCRFHHDQRHFAVHAIAQHDTYAPPACPRCDETMTRDYSTVQIAPVTQEHFSSAVGKNVSSHRQLRDELDRKADEMSERLGFEQRYGLADPGDVKHLGVNADT